MQTQGRVVKTFSKPWEGRNGQMVNLCSFQIEGDSKYYRTGEATPAKENDIVLFEYDGKGNVNPDTFQILGQATTPPPAQQEAARQSTYAPRAGGSASGGGYKAKAAEKDAYWSDKEKRDIEKERRYNEVVEPRITWASAQSDAVAVVNAALQHDLLAFGNANKSAKLGLLLEYVDQVTARFAAQRFNAAKLLKDAIAESEGTDHEDERTASRNDNDLG